MKRIFSCAAVVCLLLASGAVLAQDPTSRKVSALLQEGRVHAEAKEFEKALFKAREALKLAPRDPSCLATTACYEHCIAEYESGLSHALQALKVGGPNPWVHAMVGFNAYGSQDFDLARRHLEKAVAAGPDKIIKTNYDHAKNVLQDLKGRTYSIVWTFDPKKVFRKEEDGYICIPCVSTNLPYQAASFELIGAKDHKILKTNGSEFLLVLPREMESFKLRVRAAVKAYTYKAQLKNRRVENPVPKEAERYLGKSWKLDPQNRVIAELARRLRTKDVGSTVDNFLKWMNEHLRYGKYYDFKDAADIIEHGSACCVGWAHLFTALCRSAGIPARPVRGMVKAPDLVPVGHLCGHSWVEVYVSGAGWIPVEPQRRKSFGMFEASYVRQFHYAVGGNLDNPFLPDVNAAQMAGLQQPEYEEGQ